jgi:two-component system sensor histidine kinase VicK
MPEASPLSAPFESLAAENQALHEQIRDLRAQQAAATEHQAGHERYEQSQARFRTVFENSPLGNKIIDADLLIRQVNPSVIAMLGFTRADELLGHKILEFAHPRFRADWHELQQQLWQHRMPSFTLETCLVRADGSSFWCQVTSVLFPDEDGELGYTLLEDISARKGLEDRLKRLYEAQETILQLATHDMKAPIAQIQLLGDLLQREVAGRHGEGPPPPEMVHYLALIQRACAHANGLLQDVLFVGDLDAHGLQKVPTELNTYLSERLPVHHLVAQEKGIDLALNLPTESVYAALQPEKFGRVLDNLISNALKFTPAGGKITLGLQAHEGRARVWVQDTGIGIPSKLHAQLFDKFNPSRRRGLQGEATTGLGLFIAKQIVELHGGQIWLESREQEGTTFFIELA